MNIQTYLKHVEKIRQAVRDNRGLWYEMDRAGVCSYRYLVKLEKGQIQKPSVEKLSAISGFLAKKPRPRAVSVAS